MLDQRDLEGLFGRLILGEYPERKISGMSVRELKDALKDIPGIDGLTISYAPATGNQLLHLGDKTVEVGPAASNDEIRAALQNPFIPTQNTKVTMATPSPLQGFGQKLAKLKHDTEFDAGKLSARIEALAARKDAAVTKSHQYLDTEEQHVQDIEQFVIELEQANGNGAPTNG